jgi:peptidoglycan/LPS O-acetylase OafA/YrhL
VIIVLIDSISPESLLPAGTSVTQISPVRHVTGTPRQPITLSDCGREMQYRAAIDGLRAVAVILVLLFHARVPFFSGGYVGVDVFFVISGYLIAGQIHQEHVAGRFTLIGFYERRVRRIFPALFLVLLSIFAIAPFVMLPPDLGRLGSSGVAATLFISNFYFWARGQNYLRDLPDFEPLLHTWSLAIEEQFYLFFPIFVLLTLRFFKRLDLTFMGVALGSFAISIYLTSIHPRGAFYFSPSRAWELLLGAWLAVTYLKNLIPRQFVPILQCAGLIMIVGATFSYDVFTPFPGLAALIPCLGTAAIVAWCDQESRLINGLSHPALVGLGLISYPLYLWHWPSLVLARFALLREPHPYEIVALYFLAGVVATATWHYVERPFRTRNGLISARRVFVCGAGVSCLALATGGALRATEVWSTPPPGVARILAAANDYAPSLGACHNWDRKNPKQFSNCITGAKDPPGINFALWGDSHAGAVAIAVDTAAYSVSKKGLQLTADDCPPLLNTQIIISNVVSDCEARNEAAFDLLLQHRIRRAILAGAWVQYVEGHYKVLRPNNEPEADGDKVATFRQAIKQTLDLLRTSGIDVVIVGPVPEIGWDVPSVLAAKEWRKQPMPEGPSLADFISSQRKIMPILRELEHDGVHIVYPHEVLCTSTCLVQLNGQILYRDSEHLTTQGADLLRPMFVEQLSRRP